MYCTKCGKKLDDGALFCWNCGASVNQTAVYPVPAFQQTVDVPLYPNQETRQRSYEESQQCPDEEVQPPADEKVNVWPCILSVLVPLAGLIFNLVWANKRPKQSKYCGVCALTAVIVELVAAIIIGLCLPSITANGGNGNNSAGSGNTTPQLPGITSPQKPSSPPEAPVYEQTNDGVLTFVSYGSGKNICYDKLTDSVIAWSGKSVCVYARADGSVINSFDCAANVSAVSAYNGVLCVGLGGEAQEIYVVDLKTGNTRHVSTDFEVSELVVTDGYAVFCDGDQWCNVGVVALTDLSQRTVGDYFYYPKLAVNHASLTLYLAERHSSSSDFYYIDLDTLNITQVSEFGEYPYNKDGVIFDGDYVHAYGNTYDAVTGKRIVNSGHAEVVNSSDLYLLNTLLRNNGYSFIAEYNNKTVVYDNQSKRIVYTMQLAATEVYNVGGDLYFAVCGDSGYTGIIDLSKT